MTKAIRLTHEQFAELTNRNAKRLLGKSKFGAVKTETDGIKFDSKAEAARYAELKTLQAGGVITKLEVHPKFLLRVNFQNIGTYVADFSYVANGQLVVEDVKSPVTEKLPLSRWKRKHLLLQDGIEVRIVLR